jgi:hypothetical protein
MLYQFDFWLPHIFVGVIGQMLNNNKKWFILIGVIFMGMVYKSLFIPPEK